MNNLLSTISPSSVSTQLKKWSYSRLSMFEQCERQFFHKYVEKRPFPASTPMVNGKIFHKGIELMLSQGYTPDEALSYAIEESGGLPEGEQEYLQLTMLDRALKRIPEREHAEMTSELHLEIETPKGLIQGFVDIVIDDPATDTTEILDFKTSWVSYAADTSRQLALYAWLFREMRGGLVGGNFKGKLIFPRLWDEDTEVVFTEQAMEDAKNWAFSVIDKISERNPSSKEAWRFTEDRSKCDYCPYVALCAGDTVEGLPADGTPKNEAEAEMIGEYILFQENVIKNMKAGLKKWVKESNPVTVGNGHWILVKSDPNPKCDDLKKLRIYAERNGLEMEQAIKPDPKILKEWLKGDESGDLEAIITWTSSRENFKYEKK